jgi:hypothetical protein
MTVVSPASINEITPPQMQLSFDMLSSVGKLASKTVGAPGAHGNGVAGMQGIGVKTPIAADVAAAVAGNEGDEHGPKGMILTMVM